MLTCLFAGIGLACSFSYSSSSSPKNANDGRLIDLPELLVNSRDKQVLHILAYVREYSTMTTYSDTVRLYREKWVDFMVPTLKARYRGWLNPRLLTSRSYYRFSDNMGLDSVSDRYRNNFSWGDWVGIAGNIAIPEKLRDAVEGNDTLRGKYSPYEIWRRKGEDFHVEVNLIADSLARRWTPAMRGFFESHLDFDRFYARYDYANVISDKLYASDLNKMEFDIESVGRGRDMFRFNRQGEQFYVTTHGEIYIADKEYISVREAKKWESKSIDRETMELLAPPSSVPDLDLPTAELVARVEAIDHDGVRLNLTPDKRLGGREIKALTRKQKILKSLKSLIGL